MNRLVRFLLLFSSIAVLGARAQSTVPTLSTQMPARVLVAGGNSLSIRLTDHFTVPGVTGTVVQFDTVKGKINVELRAADAPKTVANFLNYVNRGAYTNNIIHRSATDPHVIQGGGFFLSGTSLPNIPADPPIELEVKLSNTRGTIAMARTSVLNSATSQWYFNVNDNIALNTVGGGYAVFGQVLGTGMSVVDAIAAVPVYNATGQLGAGFGELPLLTPSLTAESLVLVRSIKTLPVYPDMAATSSVVTFGGSLGADGIVSAGIAGSTLTLKPLAAGTTNVNITATDTNGNTAQGSFTVTVVAAPLFTAQPVSQTLAAGASGTLSVVATGGAALQWQRNGFNLPGIDSATVNINPMEPGLAGIYTVVASSGSASTVSSPAILGVSTSSKVIGTGSVVGSNIAHPNGKTFDQVLLEGAAAAITAEHAADPARITRMSYIDLDHDIVQVEFAGPGTLTLTLDEMTAAAPPTKYNQPGTSYVRGHASIVITGADERTNLTVFTVGRATAVDPQTVAGVPGGYDILQIPSETNVPANNRSNLFVGHSATVYDGVADISRIAIASTNGKFGGIRAANANLYDIRGYTGIYAPGVTFEGPVYVGNINAHNTATPVFIIGGAVGETRITGGNLLQANGQPIQVAGITKLRFTAGSDSHGRITAAQDNYGLLHQNGQDVTTQLVLKVP